MLEQWNKVHLLGVLSASLGLTSYLEITTALTGHRYGEAQALSFEPCMRLVYRLRATAQRDGLPIDFGSPNIYIAAPLAEIRARGLTFDLILVDAHHIYDCASRDLAAAFGLLNAGGAILVHDCNPATAEIASPVQNNGEWCGVSYKAFIDFCLGNPDINYFTVDADYGCGVIIKPRTQVHTIENRRRAQAQEALRTRWSAVGTDFDAAYALFDAERTALLRLTDFGGLRAELAAINGIALAPT